MLRMSRAGTTVMRRLLDGARRPLSMIHSSRYEFTPSSLKMHELIFSRASQFGDQTALVDGPTGRSIRYDEMEPRVRAVASSLASRGVSDASTVAILSPNSIEYPFAFHGVAMLGARVTTMNPLYTSEEIHRQLIDSGATQMIVASGLLEKAYEAIALGAPVTRVYTLEDAEAAAPPAASPPLESYSALLEGDATFEPSVDFDPHTHVGVVPYSSGTSGMPKGVELTHSNVVANVLQIEAHHVRLDSSDTLVGVLPFFHIYGMTVILQLALCSGAKVVTMPGFEPALFLKVLKQYEGRHAARAATHAYTAFPTCNATDACIATAQ